MGKSGIFDHEWTAKGQAARIYRTEIVEEESVCSQGEGRCYLKGYAYMLRGGENDALIAQIEGGIKKEVSVGCSVERCVCSIGGTKGTLSYDALLGFWSQFDPYTMNTMLMGSDMMLAMLIKSREIVDSYGEVLVSALKSDPTVCLVEFSFTVAHGLNRIYLTAHITV